MMSEEEIEGYRSALEFQMRDYHAARMTAMNERRYYDMEESSHNFDMIAAQIGTINKILEI